MKLLKIVLIVLWVVATTLFLVGLLTPLEFRSKLIGYLTFFIAFNGIFHLRFLLTDFISIKPPKAIIALVVSITLMVSYYFTYVPGLAEDWKTQEIIYRKKDNPNDVVASQMVRTGKNDFERRSVKMLRITPLYDWVIVMKVPDADENWTKVNEYIDEMGLIDREK
jgi:hypothetical protein